MNFQRDEPAPLLVLDSETTQDRKRPIVAAAVLLLAAVAAAGSAWLSQAMLGRIPHVPDEIAYFFQARIFAAGHLWATPPPLPDLFAFDHILLIPERWCSIYPPGWPLLLALGQLSHISRILNPLSLFLTAVGIFRLASFLYEVRTAWLAVLLFVCSPFVLLMHAGFMAHPAALGAAVWGTLLYVKGIRDEKAALFFGAGALFGLCFLTRPVSAVALLWPLLLWPFLDRRNLRAFLFAAMGFVPFAILFLGYNAIVFGHPLRSGYVYDPAFQQASFSVALIWKNAAWYSRTMNQWLWEWPWPNLLIFLPLVLNKNNRRATAILLLCSLSLVAGYCFYDYHDIVYGGPRYVFECMGFLSIVAARGLVSLWEKGASLQPMVRTGVGAAGVFVLAAFSLSHLPEQIAFHSQMYHARSHQVVEAVRTSAIGPSALVFISGNPYIYGAFLLENNLDPQRGKRVYVRDIPELESAARKVFARDETWRVRIEMIPIAGPNQYPDRWKLTSLEIKEISEMQPPRH